MDNPIQIQPAKQQNTPKLKRDFVLAQLRQYLQSLLADRPVALAYLHGSVADEHIHRESDVDIALVLSEPLSHLDQLYLELDLNVLLEQMGVHQPDVRAINMAPIEAKLGIVSRGIPVFVKSNTFKDLFEDQVRLSAKASEAERNKIRRAYVTKLKAEVSARGLVNAKR